MPTPTVDWRLILTGDEDDEVEVLVLDVLATEEEDEEVDEEEEEEEEEETEEEEEAEEDCRERASSWVFVTCLVLAVALLGRAHVGVVAMAVARAAPGAEVATEITMSATFSITTRRFRYRAHTDRR